MPSFEGHCGQSEQSFRRAFEEVHLWLDEFAGVPGIGTRHRPKRHHLRGLACSDPYMCLSYRDR
jgi:hypothetical protein